MGAAMADDAKRRYRALDWLSTNGIAPRFPTAAKARMTTIPLRFVTLGANGRDRHYYGYPALRSAAITVFGVPAGDLSDYPVFTMDSSVNRCARPGEKVNFNAAR